MRKLSQIPGLLQPELLQATANMRAFRKEYAKLVAVGELYLPEDTVRLPVEAMLEAARAEAANPASRKRFRRYFAEFSGTPITEAQLDDINSRALARWEETLKDLSDADFRQPHLFLHNLESDGVFFLGQGRFVWAVPGGVTYAASDSNEVEWDVAAMVMVGSIVVEAIGIVAAIAGVALPTGKNLDRLGVKLWARLKPEHRARFIRFMTLLLDPDKGIEAKIKTIFQFLKWLNGLGLIHLAINDLLDGWDWLDIALTIAQILLTLASLLIPAAAAASIAARLVAIANALTSIIRKIKALKGNLETM